MRGIVQEEIVERHQLFILEMRGCGGDIYLRLFRVKMCIAMLLLHFLSKGIDGEQTKFPGLCSRLFGIFE